MQISEIIRQLKAKNVKATVTGVKKVARELHIEATDQVSDEEAKAIMDHMMGHKRNPATNSSCQADKETLTRVLEQGEYSITNEFSRQMTQVKGELIEAKKARDLFVEQASDALVTLATETRPLIYHRAAEKLRALSQADQQTDFSLAALAEDVFLSDFSSTSNFLSEGKGI